MLFRSLLNKHWGKNEDGSGISILSQDVNLSVKLKVKSEGILRIFLNGPDFPDINNKKIPIYIDFRKITLNNEKELLDSSTLVSLTDKHVIDVDVSEGEVLDLKFKWLPVNIYSDSENIHQDLKKMTERYENLRYKKAKRKAQLEANKAKANKDRKSTRLNSSHAR